MKQITLVISQDLELVRFFTLMVAVISVDVYPLLAFSDLICHLEDTVIAVFWLHSSA